MATPEGIRVVRWTVAIFAFLVSSLAFRAMTQSPHPAANQARVPVLVELFTSEGCSDCPPADRILEELDTSQSVPGAQAIVLSEHVTYWDHQGWRDPFSLDAVDERQKEYGDRFNLDSVYTPQAVIDGSVQLVGNNAGGMAKAVEHAATSAKKLMSISDAHWDNGAVSFAVHGAGDSASRLVAVLAADVTGHQVTRGENAGRTLHHVAVMRSIKDFGADSSAVRSLRLPAGNLTREQQSGSMRVIAFLADKKTGRIVAVAEQALSQ